MSLQVDSKTFIHTNISLKSYSTYKIGGVARFFAEPHTQDELIRILEFRRSEGLRVLIIGRGSNLLISDDGFDGLAISLRQMECERFSVENKTHLIVSAGMSLCRVSMVSAEESLSGSEFMCHIPGTVGGAVIMNAGFGRRDAAYREIKDILDTFTAVDLNGNFKKIHSDEIEFDYRQTNIPQDLIILEAKFRLIPRGQKEVEAEIKANFAYRNEVQDLRFPSAGSTFKNPKGCSYTSGQLLDRVQMKKVRIGGAMVSDRHANFFLNIDRATSRDVLDLIALAQKRVFEEFGVELHPEVRYVS